MINTIDYIPFPKDEIQRAIKHAEDEFPNEACGVFVNNIYVPFRNEAEEKERSFLISDKRYFTYYSENKIQAVLHSHNNTPHASKEDLLHQRNTELPFIIMNLKYGKLEDVFYFGFNNSNLPLEGRPFHFGAFDCLTLTYDYFIRKYNVALPNPPRDIDFVKNDEKLFEKYLAETPFEVVKKEDMLPDNILFYTWRNKVCHIGVYLGEDKVLGHWMNQLSGVHSLQYKYDNISFAMELRR